MSSASLTGNDTIQVAGRNLVNLADQDVAKLTFPNELVGVKVGKVSGDVCGEGSPPSVNRPGMTLGKRRVGGCPKLGRRNRIPTIRIVTLASGKILTRVLGPTMPSTTS